MRIRVTFHSFFRDLAGTAEATVDLDADAQLTDVLKDIFLRFPKLQPMEKSMLTAVGVEYQKGNYRLRDGDEVALFPPVQGG